MASRRYSTSDQQKMIQDRLADLRAKGIDAREAKFLHPGGPETALNQMEENISYVRDQSQEQIERNREKLKKTSQGGI